MDMANTLFGQMEEVFTVLVRYAILLLEFIGVAIILWTVFRCLYCAVTRTPQNLKLLLAHGIAFGLEFKLGGEVLRTILAESFEEIAMIACVIALRAALTFLLHWEVKQERHEEETGGNETDIAVIKPRTPRTKEKK